ncbi:MAG: hypothetical protein C3F12_12795 [Candidatus Methylomirabilota bacterium]|nr:hypothetical protein [candidate division NC10 bacterium]PWB43531.1 MAG: hypothetical protein C3F12_12795 [candidate division NC10 bacterium]
MRTETIERKNFMVNRHKVQRLRELLGVKSESEAVRVAIDHALAAEQVAAALKGLQRRGTWVNAYERTPQRSSRKHTR